MIVVIMKCYPKKKGKCKFANLLPSSPSYMGTCYVAGFMNQEFLPTGVLYIIY